MLCKDCKDKSCLKTSKPCKRVEQYLRANKIYDRDYIRPQVPGSIKKWNKDRGVSMGSKWREIPFSALSDDVNEDKNGIIN